MTTATNKSNREFIDAGFEHIVNVRWAARLTLLSNGIISVTGALKCSACQEIDIHGIPVMTT